MQKNIFQLTFITRNIIRSYARRKLANPGIQKRLNLLTEKQEAPDDINVDELESDFLKLGEVHRAHENELKDRHEKEKYLIVRQKYFKQTQINFLSWSDKEQIRFLHQSNPEEWTIEKLTEGFPALPDTIIKIIKGKWQKQTDLKKINHDKAVEKNWELLREGKLELPDTLIAHLTKFSARKRKNAINSNKLVVNSEKELPRQNNEFSSIINSYTELKNSTTLRKPIEGNRKTEDSKLLYSNEQINRNTEKSSIDNRLTTLGRLKENIAEKLESNNFVSKDDTFMVKSNKMENDLEINNAISLSKTIENAIKNKHKSNKLTTVQKKPNAIKAYPEHIIIPKNKFKQGLTYKVNDCYYDDDGEFLYRVPGMK